MRSFKRPVGKRLGLAAMVLFAFAGSVSAQTVCPQCGQVHAVNRVTSNSFQAQAQAEAQRMASRRYKGHVQGTVSGVRFSGVGWSSSSPNAPTCTPGGGMSLVADAVARGADGWYRVRYWR